jgi:hypothetical protein
MNKGPFAHSCLFFFSMLVSNQIPVINIFSRQTHKTKGIEKKKRMERINGWVWFNDSTKRDLRINGTLSNK